MSKPGEAPRVSTLDRYKQGFQEEAREILVELEATLLALNQSRGDMELIGSAFRGLHTIKGSGSMFGFVKLAGFTHKLENAFDEVRNGRLEVSSELVELTLAALDQMKAMLLEADGQGAADEARCGEILAKLLELMGQKGDDAPARTPAVPDTDAPQTPPAAAEVRRWSIDFRPGAELIRSGSDPLLLLRDLRKLGQLDVTAKTEAIPPLMEIDPERCYLKWELVLASTATEEEIRDVFIFCDDLCDLTVERMVEETTKVEAVAAPVESAPMERRAFGRRSDDRTDGAMSIRVPTPKLDQFVDLVGELVTVQARLAQIASRGEDADIVSVSEEVERLTSALRENSMSIRMLPIRATFERFRRLVHDLARDLHKEVELTIEGADMRLCLEMSKTERTTNTCIVVLEVMFDQEPVVIGALADSVEEVIDLEPDQIRPAPRIGTQIRTDFIKGMGKRDAQFIMILDIDRVFSTEDLGVMKTAEGSRPAAEMAA